MKTLKSLLVIAMLTVVSYGVNAQITEEITASATVQTALTIDATAAINFGEIAKSTVGNIVLDPQGLAHQNTGAARQVGTFEITGDKLTTIQLLFPSTLTLSKSGADDIIVTLDVNGKNSSLEQATSLDLTSGSTIATATSGDDEGKYFLWVGGSISPLGVGQATGTYTGSATFTVAYN